MTAVTAFAGRPVGDVEALGEGLFVGFLAHPGLDALGTWNIDFDTWTRLFAKTLERLDEAKAAPPATVGQPVTA